MIHKTGSKQTMQMPWRSL